VVSVVTRLGHTSIYGSLLRFTVHSPIYEPFFDSPLYNSLPILSSFPYDFNGFDTSSPSPLFDSKPSGFCGCYGTYRGSGTFHFTVLFPIYEPFSPSIPLYAFGSYPIPSAITYEFGGFGTPLPSPLFDSKSSNFCSCDSSYSGFWYTLYFTLPFSIYGSLFRFSNLPLPPSRPVMPVLRL
jgi:hypothetical protein